MRHRITVLRTLGAWLAKFVVIFRFLPFGILFALLTSASPALDSTELVGPAIRVPGARCVDNRGLGR